MLEKLKNFCPLCHKFITQPTFIKKHMLEKHSEVRELLDQTQSHVQTLVQERPCQWCHVSFRGAHCRHRSACLPLFVSHLLHSLISGQDHGDDSGGRGASLVPRVVTVTSSKRSTARGRQRDQLREAEQGTTNKNEATRQGPGQEPGGGKTKPGKHGRTASGQQRRLNGRAEETSSESSKAMPQTGGRDEHPTSGYEVHHVRPDGEDICVPVHVTNSSSMALPEAKQPQRTHPFFEGHLAGMRPERAGNPSGQPEEQARATPHSSRSRLGKRQARVEVCGLGSSEPKAAPDRPRRNPSRPSGKHDARAKGADCPATGHQQILGSPLHRGDRSSGGLRPRDRVEESAGQPSLPAAREVVRQCGHTASRVLHEEGPPAEGSAGSSSAEGHRARICALRLVNPHNLCYMHASVLAYLWTCCSLAPFLAHVTPQAKIAFKHLLAVTTPVRLLASLPWQNLMRGWANPGSRTPQILSAFS